jgi:hypothetical protein
VKEKKERIRLKIRVGLRDKRRIESENKRAKPVN